MNSVTAPSRPPASRRNLATSGVRSTKPAPDVCTVNSDDTMLLAATEDGLRATIGLKSSNPAADVLLNAVGHVDQPPPGLLERRPHAVHVAVARQGNLDPRNFDLALTLGDLRLRRRF